MHRLVVFEESKMASLQVPQVAPRQFVVVSRTFGYPIYVSDLPGDLSEGQDDAIVYRDDQDNGQLKARYFSTIMGYPFNVEYVQ